MKYLVMECRLSYAVVLDSEGRFLKVPNLGYTVGQTLDSVVLLPETAPVQTPLYKRLTHWGALAACLCVMLLSSWSFWQSPIGTVRIQINPDMQMSVNRFDRVVALEGLNNDGQALIDGYRSYGKEMQAVSDDLADRAMELGYLSGGGEITLTVESEQDSWKTATEELLLLELEVHFDHQVTVTVAEEEPNKAEPLEKIVIAPAAQPEDTDRNRQNHKLDDDADEDRDDRGRDDRTDGRGTAARHSNDDDFQDDTDDDEDDGSADDYREEERDAATDQQDEDDDSSEEQDELDSNNDLDDDEDNKNQHDLNSSNSQNDNGGNEGQHELDSSTGRDDDDSSEEESDTSEEDGNSGAADRQQEDD